MGSLSREPEVVYKGRPTHELLNLQVFVLSSHNTSSMPLSASGASAKGAFSTRPLEEDPYEYQVGFGNYSASEEL